MDIEYIQIKLKKSETSIGVFLSQNGYSYEGSNTLISSNPRLPGSLRRLEKYKHLLKEVKVIKKNIRGVLGKNQLFYVTKENIKENEAKNYDIDLIVDIKEYRIHQCFVYYKNTRKQEVYLRYTGNNKMWKEAVYRIPRIKILSKFTPKKLNIFDRMLVLKFIMDDHIYNECRNH